MTPAASDEQSHQSSGDNNLSAQGQLQANQESEASGKSKKKGKNGTKGKDKAANNKSTAKMTPEDLTQTSSPIKTESSSCPNGSFGRPTSNNDVVSPVLKALGSLGTTQDNDTAYRTDAWTKSIPIGKSPPTDHADGGFVSESPLSFPTAAEKGGFSHASTSTSPPLGRARPMSYGGGYPSFTSSRHQSVDRHKRHSSSQFQSGPPLPHLPQAHFYGAPEVDLPLFSGQNRPPMDASYSFCAFDTISSPSFKSTKMGGKVLVVGSDGALEVLAIEDRKTRAIGRIVGLNGRVVDAKLLSWTSQSDPFASSRPHVAVIVHGPVCQKDDGGGSSSSGSEQNEMPPGLAGKRSSFEKHPSREETIYYQTKVEVYSLRSGEYITTLFTSKPVPCLDTFPGLPLYAPGPVGNLKLYASGNFVVVASGVSGEVYVYGVVPSAAPTAYQCLAKTWTSVQSRDSRRYSASSSSTDPDGSQADSPHGPASPDSPILSLSGRWLAIVPPSSTSRAPLHGTVPASLVQRKIYGLDTHIPPPRPAVTCATDAGEEESFLNKFARGVTQELVKGARWMGDQGLQAWNNYWNKEQQTSQTAILRHPMQQMDQGYNIFPPTHAQETQTASPTEPDLVSLIDLKKLEDNPEVKSSFPHPVATFQVPNGCSFLAFSPNGLMLMTASKKGDIQYVWDLMQVKNCRAGAFLADDPTLPSANAHVRQVARYARLTTSRIVDVIWTAPTGERLAIITRKGTIHVFDLPRSAFQWPPLRRARPLPAKPQNDDSAVEEFPETTASGNPFSVAMKLVGGKTQPILAAVRGRAPSVGPAFPSVSSFGISAAVGVRGGKAVAAGLSKSVGAATGTVNTLRHAGENRLHLSAFSRDPAPSRVAWFCNKDVPLLGLVDGGYFKLYGIGRSLATKKNRQGHSIIGGKVTEFNLPAHLQNPCGPIPVGTLNADSAVSASWALPSSKPHSSSAAKLKSQPLSQAEIETNAPYQPFHTDQRVNLYVFTSEGDASHSMMASITGPWVFGNEIPMSKLYVRPVSRDDDDEDVAHENRAGSAEMENHISLGNGGNHAEEVVITTRRKKKKHTDPFVSMIEDDGFFEDDCEVLDFARDRV
ncbi:hypothetical protein VTN00DRAFT_7935 [Thermoascus crustaceus]|uniref:uncharacterized protein n=1 Tax=Thermoascus crustaceus TaxID=5088 RepID=UPI00374407A0